MKNYASLPLIFSMLCLISTMTFAQEYSAQNPYKPSAEKIEQLKQIIPGFPETPPMGDYTSLYQEKFVISDHPPGMFKYYLHLPENMDATKSYPVIMLLHGGARHMNGGAEYFKLGLHQSNPAIVIIPIAPPGYDWNSAAPLALEALQDVAKQVKMNPQQIYLSGYSMGGIGVYSVLARYPGIFAGAFSACGTYDPKLVAGVDKNTALLIWHGQKDQTFPVSITREIHGYLKSSGHNVAYLEQADAGHGECVSIYQKKGFWNWLLKQRKS